MKFVFFRIFLFFLGVFFLGYFCIRTKVFFQSETTATAVIDKQAKAEEDNSLFNLIKIIKLFEKKKIFQFKGKLIKKIVLVPKLFDKENGKKIEPNTAVPIKLDLEKFKNVKEENFNCQNDKKIKEECISKKIKEWKSENNETWDKLEKVNALYAKMGIDSAKEIETKKDEVWVSGRITKEKYNVWKSSEPNYSDEKLVIREKLVIQGLILEIINWNYQHELNNKLKEMKNQNFFEIIDAKADLLLEAKIKNETKTNSRAGIWTNLVVSLRELKNISVEEIDIKKLNLDQFLGFWYIKEIKNKEDLEKLLLQFADEPIKDSRRIKEEKWYIITLAVGGGVIFLLIVNYIFWKFKK